MCSVHHYRVGQGPARGGFTLIEILIVVVILGILAAIVIPQFSNAAHTTRENTLKDDLRYLRTQIIVFKAQHRDVPPGYPSGVTAAAPDAAVFVAQMRGYTDENCNINPGGQATAVYKFGPYLVKMPPNPLNGLDTVRIVGNGAAVPAPTGEYGWIYKPQTTEIIADLTGADSDGKSYREY